MAKLELRATIETLALAKPFRISGYVFETSDVVVVTLSDGAASGRGEGSGVYYLGDDAAHMMTAIETARPAVEAGATRAELRAIMPPGGARNAIDAALWDLESQQRGKSVWALAGLSEPRPLVTTFTLGADDPDVMAEGARAYADARSIKVKLTGELDLDIARVQAIRAARPDVWLGVDGNQGFAIGDLDRLTAALHDAGVSLLEQPLARGAEADLDGYRAPLPIAADESALTLDDVGPVARRFDVFNIKLDKCGGLTEGLMIAEAARDAGIKIMVGNMVGTSLAMAPGFVLGQHCDIVDLDGPIFLKQDREAAVEYRDGSIWCGPAVWGGGGN
jgi:L-alanine-DL-glutamate epimerase-like enolase superfamily enzyme